MEDMYEFLFNGLINHNLHQFMKQLYEYFHHPMVLCDVNYVVLTQHPNQQIGDMLFDHMQEHQKVAVEMLPFIQLGNYQKDLDQNNNVIYVDYGVGQTIPRIIAAITDNDNIIGYLCILFADGKPSSEIFSFISKLAKTIASIICHSKTGYNYNRYEYFAIMNYLFSNDNINKRDLEKLLPAQPNTFSKDYCIITTKVDFKSNEIVYLNQLHQYIITLPNTYSYLQDNCLYILITGLNGTTKNNIINKVKSLITAVNIYKLKFGISYIFDNLLDINIYKHQALKAYDLSKQQFTFFEDIALESFFTTSSYKIYLHPLITKLKQIDESTKNDYYHTLKSYICNFGDSHKTIEQLAIHRNTLLYRLEKIKEFTNVDLHDEKLCTLLLISFFLAENN